MASIGIAHFKSLENGVVALDCFSSKSLFTSRFRCFSTNGSRTNLRFICKNKRQTLAVVNAINPEADSNSTPSLTTTIEIENYAANVVDKSYLSTPDSKTDVGGGGFIDGSGGNGKFSGGGGGGGNDDGGDDYEEKEFGPILKFEEVIRETEARGASLPADMLEAAKTVGLRKLLLERYLDLQVELFYLFVFKFYSFG